MIMRLNLRPKVTEIDLKASEARLFVYSLITGLMNWNEPPVICVISCIGFTSKASSRVKDKANAFVNVEQDLEMLKYDVRS